MLLEFSPIFVTNTKMICGYNFAAPLMTMLCVISESEIFLNRRNQIARKRNSMFIPFFEQWHSGQSNRFFIDNISAMDNNK